MKAYTGAEYDILETIHEDAYEMACERVSPNAPEFSALLAKIEEGLIEEATKAGYFPDFDEFY